ncbi:MAG: glucose-6-phosphate 1-dehydrogenase [Candidatus Tectimicrobiota bacterium]|nr:MAG: glucose-6-phosphate 1-dehydrogenase [Candidatus Tectomicrobia bacterium]
MTAEREPRACTMVIFGATGDLTRRKLIPGLYSLAKQQLLPSQLVVIGFARRPKTHEQFRQEMRQAVCEFARFPLDEALWERFASRFYYHQSTFDDAEGYRRLGALLRQVEAECGTQGRTIYYLATPPEAYYDIVHHLHAAGLTQRPEMAQTWPRIVVEKPFGRDLATARELNRHFRSAFGEEQIYRIDHYLGKETVQNIMVLRFANGIFEPLWNQKYIDHVQITVSETVGVEDRGGYYDTTGALRDMVQNHLLQLLTLTAMEPPGSLRADAVRNEKMKVLETIRPLDGEAIRQGVVRGQYTAGSLDGQPVPAYCQEPRVKPDSRTETFVALKLWIDNWRWAGVPFYLRTGKRLPRRLSEIAIQFKPIPQILFRAGRQAEVTPNVLVLHIQPDEGASLTIVAKAPGLQVRLQSVEMEFQYGTSFEAPSPEAYERLLRDVMIGDQTLFMRGDEVEAAWSLVTPILEYWDTHKDTPLHFYPAGTWGPAAAEALLANDGRRWRHL